jgi:hypothetical protein
MKSMLCACLVASLCFGTAIAQDLGNSRELPVKNTPIVTYEPPAEPKQGGDTIGDATLIPDIPYSNTGTTAGYIDDYDEVCPYDTPGSPDVVYSFLPGGDMVITVDLFGSIYDTKVYIYDESLNLIACNDDFYSDYVSKIEQVPLIGGVGYFIVIDGYGSDAGDYVLNLIEYEPCFVYCPDDAVPEGEPPLHDGYEDLYNGGCSGGLSLQQPIDWTNDEDGVPPYDGTAWMCGKSGWYIGESGGDVRDTDWFTVFALETGVMEVTLEPEYRSYLFKLAPTDCDEVGVELQALADCEAPETLSFPVTAGEEIWLWVGPANYTGPVTEFTYFMTVSNNTFDVVPNEGMSWGQVKSLYR